MYFCFLYNDPLDFKILKIGPLVTLSCQSCYIESSYKYYHNKSF
jgi:hypothetical protein